MIRTIFPISEYWSWGTFLLYFLVSVLVTRSCRTAAKYKATAAEEYSIYGYTKRYSNYKLNYRFFYFIAFLILVLLATLRSSDVGADTHVYVDYFEKWRTYMFDWNRLFSFQQMEPGFQLYLHLVRRITSNYTVFFLITYSFVAWAYIRYISFFYNEKSNYIFLQLFIFFYVSNMSGMRAAMGTVFLLLSYIKIEKNEYLKAAILTLFACTFHYSMLYNFFIIAGTWIYRKPVLRQRKWLWVVLMVLVTGFASTSVAMLKGLFSDTKYSFYSSVSIADQSLLGSVFYILYAVLCIINYKRIMNANHYIKGQLILTLCFMVTYPMIYVTAAYRIPNYYAMPRIVVWGDMSDIAIGSFGKDGNQKMILRIVLQIIIILYLLFRFTRSARVGSFTYILW